MHEHTVYIRYHAFTRVHAYRIALIHAFTFGWFACGAVRGAQVLGGGGDLPARPLSGRYLTRGGLGWPVARGSWLRLVSGTHGGGSGGVALHQRRDQHSARGLPEPHPVHVPGATPQHAQDLMLRSSGLTGAIAALLFTIALVTKPNPSLSGALQRPNGSDPRWPLRC